MLSVEATCRLGDFLLDVAFDGPADGITVLVGPSGAGKSVTLSIIAGMLRPRAGRVALGDRVLTDTVAGTHVAPQHRRAGIVHQDARLFPHMPVRANLLYGWKRARSERRIGVDAVVSVLGIAHLLERRTSDLSGGERQRVGLGRAMLSQPDLLLLDEPVSALDARHRAEVLTFIADLKTTFRLPMIYVTHSEAEARLLGDVVVRLEAGSVVAVGPPSTVLAEKALEGRVVARDDAGTTALFGGRTVQLPRIDAPPGTPLRISW